MRSHKHQLSSHAHFPHRPWDKVRKLCALRPGSCPHLGLLSHFHCSEKPHFVSSLRPGLCCSLGLPLAGGLPRDQARPVPAALTLWCSHWPPPPPKGRHPSACPRTLAQHQCAENPCAGNTGRDRGPERGKEDLRPQSKDLSCPPVAQTPRGLQQAASSTSYSASPPATGVRLHTHTHPNLPATHTFCLEFSAPGPGPSFGEHPHPRPPTLLTSLLGKLLPPPRRLSLFLSQPESPVGPYLCGEWTSQRTAE